MNKLYWYPLLNIVICIESLVRVGYNVCPVIIIGLMATSLILIKKYDEQTA